MRSDSILKSLHSILYNRLDPEVIIGTLDTRQKHTLEGTMHTQFSRMYIAQICQTQRKPMCMWGLHEKLSQAVP